MKHKRFDNNGKLGEIKGFHSYEHQYYGRLEFDAV
jgi:hypothetical protein